MEPKHCVIFHAPKEKTLRTGSGQQNLPAGYYAAIAPHSHIVRLSGHLHILFRRDLEAIKKKEAHLHSSLARLSQRKIPALKLYYFENNPLYSSQFHETISE